MNRPSPSESATKFKEGQKKKGNNGNMWEVIVAKNGVKRWKEIKTTKTIKKFYNNFTYARKFYDEYEKNAQIGELFTDLNKKEQLKFISNMKKTINKWAKYLKPAYDELMKNGIVSLLYPTQIRFIDWASDDAIEYIRNNKDLIKFLEKRWNVKFDFKYDYDPNVPHLYYMIPSNETNEIYLKHNLNKKEQVETVDKVFTKHFGKKYLWNKQSNKSIKIKLKDIRSKPSKSYIQMIREKLRKDGIATTIIQKGYREPYTGDKMDPKKMTILKFSVSEKKIEDQLKKYGFRKSTMKPKMYNIVYEDTFKIIPGKKIVMNNLDGISGTIYENIRN